MKSGRSTYRAFRVELSLKGAGGGAITKEVQAVFEWSVLIYISGNTLLDPFRKRPLYGPNSTPDNVRYFQGLTRLRRKVLLRQESHREYGDRNVYSVSTENLTIMALSLVEDKFCTQLIAGRSCRVALSVVKGQTTMTFAHAHLGEIDKSGVVSPSFIRSVTQQNTSQAQEQFGQYLPGPSSQDKTPLGGYKTAA